MWRLARVTWRCSSRRSAVTCSSLSLPIMLDRRPWSPLAIAVPAISETQQYVRCVFAAYEQYRQPGAAPLLPGLRPLQPGTRTLSPRPRSLTPSVEARQTLVVSPLRLSSQVAQVGQRLTVELEAINTSKRSGHGIVMLNYPEHLVSFMALHTVGQATTVQLPAAPTGPPAPAAPATTAYQLLWSHWPVWAPGERPHGD